MKKLLTLLDIRAGEERLISLVLLYTLCATTTDILVSATAYALFLSEFDAQRLPYIYIGVSIGSVITSTLYLQLSRRYDLAQMLLGKHLFLLVSLVGYRLSLAFTDGRWLLFSLPIWHGVVNVLLYIAFWNLVGRLFNLQQGKRLFGLFGAGQQVATLVVGFLVPLLVVSIGTHNLLAIAALTGGAALVLLFVIARTFPILYTSALAESAGESEKATSSQPLLGDSYIRLIFGMFALFTLGSYFVDNIFYNRLESQYPNEDQLASFLGLFTGVNAGVSLLYQLFVSNRLLRRYGVRAAVILTPLLLLVGTLLFTLTGAIFGLTPVHLWLAAGMFLTLQVMNDTDNTAANLLYQPLPTAARTRTQTIADGILSPSAVGVTGILLLILTDFLHFDALHLAYVLLPILVAWALAGRLLGLGYGERVQQALHQRLIQGKHGFQPDRASLEIIQQTLSDPHPGAVIYALDVLDATNRAELARSLPGLLAHPSRHVRLEALQRLERLGEPAALPAIHRCWQGDADPSVRSAALQTLATLGGVEYFDELYTYLPGPNPQLRRSVMIGLLRSGELQAILAVGETLAHLVNSPSPTDRILAAQVLGESGVTGFYHPLRKMLDDPQPAVQRAALSAAGKLQHPKLWPQVIACLGSPKTRATARLALLSGGERLLPTLKALLLATESASAFPTLPQAQMQREFARICSRIRSTQASALLLPNLDYPDVHVRTQTLQALYQCGYRADSISRPQIEQQLQAELAHAAWTLAGIVDLGDNSTVELVRKALTEALAQQRLRLFWWLSLLYDAPTMQRMRALFEMAQGTRRLLSQEQHSYLIEAFDLSIAKPLSQQILPLLEELTPSQRYAQLATAFPQPVLTCQQRLHAIITGTEAWVSNWLRAAALYDAVKLTSRNDEVTTLQMAATAASASPDRLLHETARWTATVLERDAAIKPAEELSNHGENRMLLTIEKIIILKTIDIFADTPDEVLVEIADLLQEIEAPADTTIFVQGEPGDSMYIIVTGEVAAVDGERVFTHMGERQVFGEMALLDGEPRTATIRTTQTTQLLRLDQEPFFELMDDRIEIARGIIHVLLQRLRARTNDVMRLREQLNKQP